MAAKRRAIETAAGLAFGLLLSSKLARRKYDLKGKAALVTGGSRGLGFLLARELGRNGCRVAICARDAHELERAKRDLESEGIEVFTAVCDIGEEASVDQLIATVNSHFGRIDVLVNNAGIIQIGPVTSMTRQDFEDAMNVMFWGVVRPSLAVLPQMIERREGRIVNITSVGGKISPPRLLPYTSAKFGAVGFSEGLRTELAPYGVKVVTVVPGLMRTGSYVNAFFKGNPEREFTWFSVSASAPLLSMGAERAARRIVRAAKHGDAELILTPAAKLGVRFHGLFPGTTANLLGLANRLASPFLKGAETRTVPGHEVRRRSRSRLREVLTTLGQAAGVRFHEYHESSPDREAGE